MDDLSLAKKLMEIGDKNGALKELSRILKSNPCNIEAWLLCAQATEDINQKMDCYRSVLRYDPNNPQAERELKILLSPTQVITKPNLSSKDSTNYQQMMDISKTETKGKDFLQLLVSDKVFRIVVPLMIGLLLILFGILFLGKRLKSSSIQPTPVQSPPNLLTPIRIILVPTDGLYPSTTPKPTSTPVPTRTRVPTQTRFQTNTPTSTPWFTGSAYSLCPQEDELPNDFRIDAAASRPIELEFGDEYYCVYNNDYPRIYHINDVYLLQIDNYVLNQREFSTALYIFINEDWIAENFSRWYEPDAIISPRQVEFSLPNADEAATYASTYQGPTYPIWFVYIKGRVQNVFFVVRTLAENYDGTLNEARAVAQANYYASLILEKLNP
jgi:hypothetical protein